jgi:sarcosine oxidase subunit alpha
MHRLREPIDAVTLEHDGTRIIAERGEPLAVALLASDRVLLARSPKLHRPRGPYCLRGACDGCLARVNGVPNVMTCLTSAQGGERVETQNVLGSRGVDLLQASDFLFPHGVDHHRLLAGMRGVSSVVQSFARRVAGLGKIPDRALPALAAQRADVDVLVVGGGSAGLAAAERLAARALVADDGLTPGGSLRALDPARAARLVQAAHDAGATLQSATSVLGVYREPPDAQGRLHAVLEGPGGARLVTARAVVLATGRHDPAPMFPNNDLPGIVSARAALLLWHAGVALGGRVGMLGDGRFARRLRELASRSLELVDLDPQQLVRAVGRSRVAGAIVREGGVERKIRLDALVVDGAGPPAFELAVQAGARVSFASDGGYIPERAESGAVAPGVWCCGSNARVTGDSATDAGAVASSVARFLKR